MYDIFVSYSRKNKAFVERLVRALEINGRNIWVDFDDIPFATDWWEEICAGIAASQIVVFVITPESIGSEVCGLEVKQVLKNNKRLVPIVYGDIPAKDVPPELSHLNWIMFTDMNDFDSSLKKLIVTLDTDLDKVRQHTRLLVRAAEWEKTRYNSSLLLRGDDLTEMESMLDRSDLTDLQREFVSRSTKEQFRGRITRYYVRGWLSACLVSGVWAFSVFRSDVLITPLRVIYTVAIGLGMGIFIGLLPIMADTKLTQMLIRQLPPRLQQFLAGATGKLFRILICLIMGILTWTSYLWFLGSLDSSPQATNAVLFGGIGLAAGFIISVLFTIPTWIAALLTAFCTWIPIYITFSQTLAGSDVFYPLIYFYDEPSQVFSIGITFAILIALTAHSPILLQEGHAFYRRVRSRRNPATKLT